MKILGVCASPRKGKTSFQALEHCLQAASQVPGVRTELIELAGKEIHGCVVCGTCIKEVTCSQDDDFVPLLPKLSDPQLAGLILATPVYFGGMTAQAKAFLDRCVPLRRNGFMLRNKVGGVLAVGGARNGGQELTIQMVHAAMLVQDMIIVSDGLPTSHFGGTCCSENKPDISGDEYGLTTAANLGRRVAEVAAKLHGA
jgi:multimeric flavodoxin WrbA